MVTSTCSTAILSMVHYNTMYTGTPSFEINVLVVSHHHLVGTSTTRLGWTCGSTGVHYKPPHGVNGIRGWK